MKIEPRCYKCRLPNRKVVDILSGVIEEISRWLQFGNDEQESCGYILGYQHGATYNVTLEFVTTPQGKDIRNRIRCVLRDFHHLNIINSARKNKSYYMGIWHTHPQTTPVPSSIDWDDWNKTLIDDKTGCEYAFFIIAGTINFRIWVGNFRNNSITEIFECKSLDGVYLP